MKPVVIVCILMAIVGYIPVQELLVIRQFADFCRTNTGEWPTKPIEVDSIELRGDFPLLPAGWPDGLGYIEFVGNNVVNGTLFEALRERDQLGDAVYRVTRRRSGDPLCDSYTEKMRWTESSGRHQVGSHDRSAVCLGLSKAQELSSRYAFESKVIHSRSNKSYADILGRSVRGTSYKVHDRSERVVVSRVGWFSVEIAPMLPKPDFVSQQHRCSPELSRPPGSLLEIFFQ